MSRTEFIDKLQRALAGGLNSSQVAENVRYYQEYIDSQISSGRQESEILAQLGDPRLLAKSIIEANKHAGMNYGSNKEYDEEVTSDSQGWKNDEQMTRRKVTVLPGWLVMLIVTVLVVLVIGLVTSLLSVFAPVILVALVAVLIVKIFQSNSQ